MSVRVYISLSPDIINRPGVARAVLQSASWLIHSLIQSLSQPFPPNLQNIINHKPEELGSWNSERMLTPYNMSHVKCHMSNVTCQMSHVACHVSHVTCDMWHVKCHMSHVTCHMSHVTCHFFFFDKVVKHIGGGLLSTGPTLTIFDIFDLTNNDCFHDS